MFLDVRRVIDSYDYARCERRFSKISGRMMVSLGRQRWFREQEIAADVHLFHDLYFRDEFIMSRALAHHLRDQKVHGLYVRDPANGEDVAYHEAMAAGVHYE